MIISCSRRTDIPALYADWLFTRIQEGYACVRNPMNHLQVSKIRLTPDVADGFVLWTKNPAPMLPRLHELRDYAYYFQFTLTPYGKDIEPNLPVKIKLLNTFHHLSDQVGPHRVIWRYDPILINDTWTVDTHLRTFEMMARLLAGKTYKVVISFLNTDYRNARRNAQLLKARPLSDQAKRDMAKQLSQIAGECGMEMSACAQTIDLSESEVAPAHCVDGDLFETLLGCRLDVRKDTNQRPACGCVQSTDIGMYNSCSNACRYCYANYSPSEIARNRQRHDPKSPLLFGEIGQLDTVTERVMHSCKEQQMALVGF